MDDFKEDVFFALEDYKKTISQKLNRISLWITIAVIADIIWQIIIKFLA